MPIYRYITIQPDGTEGEEFEVEQSISAEPLKFHPENNKPVKRIYDKLNINVEYTRSHENALSDMKRVSHKARNPKGRESVPQDALH